MSYYNKRVGFAIILTLIKHHRFQKQRQNNVVTEKTVEIETKQLRCLWFLLAHKHTPMKVWMGVTMSTIITKT